MNGTTRDNLHQLSIDATERMLDNLRQSDFVTHAGLLAMVELRKYGADIAGDMYAVFAGEPPNLLQIEAFVRAFPGG
jgi:hypothetical protein